MRSTVALEDLRERTCWKKPEGCLCLESVDDPYGHDILGGGRKIKYPSMIVLRFTLNKPLRDLTEYID